MLARRIIIAAVLCSGILSACRQQEIEAQNALSGEAQLDEFQLRQQGGDAETGYHSPENRTPTPELIQSLQVPEGFRVNVFARDVGNARMLAVDNGIVYVTRPRSNDVLALRDTDNDGQADNREVVVSGLSGVHGIAIRQDNMYLAAPRSVYRAPMRRNGQVGAPVTVADDLPPGGQHPHRTIGFGPQGSLYVSVGSTCNACVEKSPESAAILRMQPDGSRRQVFARGLRNTIGFGWHPQTREMWGMDIGTDWMGADIPAEELNNLTGGGNYGWPWCYGSRQPDRNMEPRPKDQPLDDFCAETRPAILTYQAHSSPIGLAFYQGEQFPQAYEGDAFIALHGSWNRRPAVGFKVARINFEGGKPVDIEDFLTGFLKEDDHAFFGRPAGVAVAPDGSLLVSDDANGMIYRVSYQR